MAEMRELTTMEELEQILNESNSKPVFVFKHSHICPISMRAFDHYRAFVENCDHNNFDFTLIMIRSHRDISNALAERVNVKHESPQGILIVNGKVVWDDSHMELTEDKFKQVVMMYENGHFGD